MIQPVGNRETGHWKRRLVGYRQEEKMNCGLWMTAYHIMSFVDDQDHSLQVDTMCSAVLIERMEHNCVCEAEPTQEWSHVNE